MVVYPLVINFAADVFTGWGQVGMNWVGLLEPEFQPLFGSIPTPRHFVGMDPVRYRTIDRAINASRNWQRTSECIVVDPIGNDLKSYSDVDPKYLIGRVIIEKADMKHAMDRLAKYDLLLTGSTWNQERIEAATGRTVKVIHEGIDPSLFCPGPRSGWSDTFNIFSSGKVEFRKAQDVTLMAFKRFSERHDDARLITLWNSPYADLGNGYKGIADQPLWLNEHGQLDIKRWAHDNGIDTSKVFEIGNIPNFALPQILRDMDAMLAPSRVESCTSLPVKEAMGCGVPVIAGHHSGMLDLLRHENSLRLKHCKPISASSEYFFPLADWEWYEPDLDEIDSHLEWVYQNRQEARKLGQRAANWVHEHRTWRLHVEHLKAWLKGVL
jgi:glycosyltransferase involved in cell wall biosynthesis